MAGERWTQVHAQSRRKQGRSKPGRKTRRERMKRAVSGKGRSGTPPLPRQRKALRVIQATLLALATVAAGLAWSSWRQFSDTGASHRLAAWIFLSVAAVGSVAAALWMGIRTVRGPQPPAL